MTKRHTQYRIRIEGHLDSGWQVWFDGLTVILTDDGNTILQGMIVDQAALLGVIKKINNLGLTLVSVNSEL